MAIPTDDRYIFRMTDDTGMFQHAVFGVPDPSEGYTTDDNARALIMAALLYEKTRDPKYETLMIRYLSFLFFAQKGGWFRNFMNYDRNFSEKRGSEDCFGRCICALGYVVSKGDLPEDLRKAAEKLLRHVYQNCSSLSSIRGKAYSLVGLALWNRDDAKHFVRMLGDAIIDTYAQSRREDWRWYETEMTYCNAILPHAMLCTYELFLEKQVLGTALVSLDFLLESTVKNGRFKPIGCKGWYQRGGTPAEFDEQPVEACSTLLACLKAYRLTGNAKYRDCAEQCLQWYHGANSAGLSLISRETGGCCDGLTKRGINQTEGAESIVCYIIAALEGEKENLRTDRQC